MRTVLAIIALAASIGLINASSAQTFGTSFKGTAHRDVLVNRGGASGIEGIYSKPFEGNN
jgi:hypothetical protein